MPLATSFPPEQITTAHKHAPIPLAPSLNMRVVRLRCEAFDAGEFDGVGLARTLGLALQLD